MSMYVDGSLAAAYNSYDAAADKLSGSLSKDYSNATDDELLSACKEFEGYFIEQVFKGMEKMIPKSDDEEESSYTSSMRDYFKDELISEYASLASEQGEGLGIAQMLYEQMKRNVAE